MTPFGIEEATDKAGAPVAIAIHTGPWNDDDVRPLQLAEGVTLTWISLDGLHRLRTAE